MTPKFLYQAYVFGGRPFKLNNSNSLKLVLTLTHAVMLTEIFAFCDKICCLLYKDRTGDHHTELLMWFYTFS